MYSGDQQPQQPAPPAAWSVKPKVLFDLRLISITQTVIFFGTVVIVVLLSLVLAKVWDVPSKITGTANNKDKPTQSKTTAASADGLIDDNQLPTQYQCRIPDAYSTRSLSQYAVWIVLGSEFATAQGVDSAWFSLLADKLKVRPTVVMAAGQFGGNLTLQAQWLQVQPEYRQLISTHQGALVFLSNGLEWLLQNPSQPLSLLDHDLRVLYEGVNPIVPLQYRSSFPLVLLSPPNPLEGGLWVDPAFTRCSTPYAIFNQPSSYDFQRLQSAQQVMHTSYVKLANQYQVALVDTNRALGAYSLARAQTLQQSAVAPTCRSFSQLGQMMLSDLLYQCFQHLPYQLNTL